jgi:hypothetical protein
MGVKRQQGATDQRDLFDEALKAMAHHGDTGEGGTGAGACAERQASTAWEQNRALTQHLMELGEPGASLSPGQSQPGRAGLRRHERRGPARVDGREPRQADRLVAGRELSTAAGARGRDPDRAAGCANWASRPWSTGSSSRRSRKFWNRSSIRPSRPRASVSARGAARTTRCIKEYVAGGYGIVVDIDLEAFFDLAYRYPPQQADRGPKVRRSSLPALSFRNALSVRGTSGNKYSPVWASGAMAIVPLWMRS